jgi:hypothetical protein
VRCATVERPRAHAETCDDSSARQPARAGRAKVGAPDDAGSGDARPLVQYAVLLHGRASASSRSSWRRSTGTAGAAGHRAVAMPRRAVGNARIASGSAAPLAAVQTAAAQHVAETSCAATIGFRERKPSPRWGANTLTIMVQGSFLRWLPGTLLLTLFACERSPDSPPTAQKPSLATQEPRPTPPPQPAKAVPFEPIDAWDGPELRSEHNFATKQIVIHFATPTSGYHVVLDGIAVEGQKRLVRLTLLQPAASEVLKQAVTDTTITIDDDKLISPEPLVVVIRRMQTGVQYATMPPYVHAMNGQ